MKSRTLPIPCALVLALFCASPGLAQKSDAQIGDDIAFAKGLAKEWGFVGLATDVIERIEREGVPTRQRERLGVTKCEIFEVGALNERDRVRRNELFRQALEAYKEFIDGNPLSESRPEAESGFVRISSAYARSIEISMEDVVGAEVDALRARRIEVLTAAVAKTGDLIDELNAVPVDDRSEAQKRDLYELKLNRGQMLLDIGRTQENGTFSFEQARQILEELVFDSGEGTPTSLRAYDMIGQVYAAQEEWTLARDFFQAVVDMAIPPDPVAWRTMIEENELEQADKEKRWLFVELSTEGLCDALGALGQTETACRYALHLYNTQKREGFSFSKQLGYPSLLAAARTLLDSGGWIAGSLTSGDAEWFADEDAAKAAVASRRNRYSAADVALRIAQQVNTENRGNVLQIHAQKLISEVIARSGVEVAPAVLFEAADGDYHEKNDVAALAGFRRVLGALDGKDVATRTEFGPKTFFRMGRTFERMGLELEAAMAFREGCTTWQGDPEYDSPNAQGFYRVMQSVQRGTPGDTVMRSLYQQSETLAATLVAADADEINFQKGERARRAGSWDEAIDVYGKISKSGNSYEKGLVWIAVCTLRKGEVDAAERLLMDYLQRFIADPINDPGSSQVRQVKRQDAVTTALFYRGFIAAKRAEASAQADLVAGVGDPALWRRVIELLDGYYKDYPDQTSYTPMTLQMVMSAHLALEEIDAAKVAYGHLIEEYEDSKQAGPASIQFYKTLEGRRARAIEQGDAPRARELLREMATLLQLGNKTASTPSYPNLSMEARHWMELGEWALAEPILKNVVAKFGAQAELEKDLRKYRLPELAHTLLELQKASEAYPILKELVADSRDLPSKQTVLDYCRSITGWVSGEAFNMQFVPGAGTTEAEFQGAVDTLDKVANSVEKWECEWYAYKFQIAYAFYVWATAEGGPKDSRKLESVKNQLAPLQLELGSQFQGGKGVPGVDANCDAAPPELAALYGGEVLRQRYVWLWQKAQ